MQHELEVARRIAREAGRILLEIYSGEHGVQWKGYDDPVTTADKNANTFIVNELRKAFPGDGILSEEATDNPSRLSQARVWMVDPMDGTRQFIDHIPEFAVMIGLSLQGKAALGVVYNPVTDSMYFGSSGDGAYLEKGLTTRRLKVDPVSDFDLVTAAMSRSHHSPVVDGIKDALGIRKSIQSGSVGLKVGLLVDGLAHFYIHPGAKTCQWDTCAPQAILEAAGGRMTDRNGEPLTYNALEIRNLKGIIATNGVIHDRVIEEVKKAMSRLSDRDD